MKRCRVVEPFTYSGCYLVPPQTMHLRDFEAEDLQKKGKIKILETPENRITK